MRQQINLYQPIFRKERKQFSAGAVLSGLAVVLCALASLWGFGRAKVSQLEAEIAHVRQQQQSQEQIATAAGALRTSRANPVEIERRVKQLSADLAGRTRAMQLLRGGAAGETTGFADRLAALARQHVDGLWLDRVALHGGSGALSLSGGTLNPDYVPRYLKALASEPTLIGARFDEFVIERPKAETAEKSGIRFRAGSASMQEEADRS